MSLDGGAKEREQSLQTGARQLRGETGAGIGVLERAQAPAVGEVTAAEERATAFQQPTFQLGQQAQQQIAGALGIPGAPAFDVTASPLFQFRQQQLERDISRRLAAAGKLRAGASIAGQFAPAFQQLSLQETQRQLQQLGALSGAGQQAGQLLSGITERAGAQRAQIGLGTAQQVAQARLGLGGQLANIQAQIGQARQQGAQATGQLLGQLGGLALGGAALAGLGPFAGLAGAAGAAGGAAGAAGGTGQVMQGLGLASQFLGGQQQQAAQPASTAIPITQLSFQPIGLPNPFIGVQA